MTSEERKIIRRERRENTRKKKFNNFIKQYNNFDLITNTDNLYKAFRDSRKNVSWKESVQKYEEYLLHNITETRKALLNGDKITRGFVEFSIHERGKIRHIRSVHISERVVQKCLCDNVIVPLFSRSLIYDNGASVKNKGIHFAIKRVKAHLHKFYTENKSNNGYALVIDFSKYFDNIKHDILFEQQKKYITDSKIWKLYKGFITVFGDNVSLGLGSQVSQISAIAYPNKLDHYIKEVLRIKYYGRYMDDIYLIHKDKEYLNYCFTEIKNICEKLKIKINYKKTKIVSLYEGFWFLKGKYCLLPSGKIVCKASRDGCVRMKRKLKKFVALVNEGKMSNRDVYESYQSFRSHLKSFDSYYLVRNMDLFYKELFHNKNIKGGSENETRHYKKCLLSNKRRCSSSSY